MPRRKRIDKRRHEYTLAVRSVLANLRAYPWESEDVRHLWERHWGSPREAREAFEALREKLHAAEGATYAQWLASFLRPDEPEDAIDDDADDEPDGENVQDNDEEAD